MVPVKTSALRGMLSSLSIGFRVSKWDILQIRWARTFWYFEW
jgi:hypothetical protein